MKKITLQIFSFLCLVFSLSFGQTYTSGLETVNGSLQARITINTYNDIVTLELIGPDNGWLSLGFNSFGHDDRDVVMFDGTNLVDRTFTSGEDEPITDSQGTHNWTVTDNIANAGVRWILATRARVSSDAGDYDFPATPTTLFVTGAYENNFNLGNKHNNKGTSTLTFSILGVDDYNKINFSMSPNPATSNLNIVLPSHLNSASIEVYDVLGRQMYNGNLINTNVSVLDVSAWNSGVYLVRVLNENSSQTKRFVKQ